MAIGMARGNGWRRRFHRWRISDRWTWQRASRSLAATEQLVLLLPPRILAGFVISNIGLDEKQLERVNVRALPTGWDRKTPPATLRKFGDDFVKRGESVALAVPSAVVRGEWNYLFNPAHEEFESLIKSRPVAFVYDKRLS